MKAILLALLITGAFAGPTLAAPAPCRDVVAFYNAAAGKNGVPDILSGWTPDRAASYRFRDAGAQGRPAADSGVTCAADGMFQKFDFVLTWTGDPPLEAMASAQLAAETIAMAVAPGASAPSFHDLAEQALDNATMLHLASQSEWAPAGDGYQAFASIAQNPTGGAITYGVRRAQ